MHLVVVSNDAPFHRMLSAVAKAYVEKYSDCKTLPD